VCDPFAGSGTSLLAAKLLDMRYVGFEIEEKTYKIARDRLKQDKIEKWC
jgi:site-specific DNA-methyltransferase (adenine-specific)